MLFDDYIFYKIESHADISEEMDDTPHETQRIFPFLRNKSAYCTTMVSNPSLK